MKTIIILLVLIIAEFFVFGVPDSWGTWTHGAAFGAVLMMLLYKIMQRFYHGRE